MDKKLFLIVSSAPSDWKRPIMIKDNCTDLSFIEELTKQNRMVVVLGPEDLDEIYDFGSDSSGKG